MVIGSTSEGVWRSGKLLVMRKGAQLPDRCVKTNQPANGKRFKAVLYWHHPAIYFLILLNLLIYVIVAIAVRKKPLFIVNVDRIQDEYVWIRGVTNEYLALLPEWNPELTSLDWNK